MRCSKCGSENREGRKFCTSCGTPLFATTQNAAPDPAGLKSMRARAMAKLVILQPDFSCYELFVHVSITHSETILLEADS